MAASNAVRTREHTPRHAGNASPPLPCLTLRRMNTKSPSSQAKKKKRRESAAPPFAAPQPASVWSRLTGAVRTLLARVDWVHVRERLTEYAKLARMHKPIGAALLLWPTWWALWLAAGDFPPWGTLIIFTLGVWLMRSAGCVINDYADRNLDPEVKRTRERPIAAGKVAPR